METRKCYCGRLPSIAICKEEPVDDPFGTKIIYTVHIACNKCLWGISYPKHYRLCDINGQVLAETLRRAIMRWNVETHNPENNIDEELPLTYMSPQ